MRDHERYCRICQQAVEPLPSGACPACYDSRGFGEPSPVQGNMAQETTRPRPKTMHSAFVAGQWVVATSALAVIGFLWAEGLDQTRESFAAASTLMFLPAMLGQLLILRINNVRVNNATWILAAIVCWGLFTPVGIYLYLRPLRHDMLLVYALVFWPSLLAGAAQAAAIETTRPNRLRWVRNSVLGFLIAGGLSSIVPSNQHPAVMGFLFAAVSSACTALLLPTLLRQGATCTDDSHSQTSDVHS